MIDRAELAKRLDAHAIRYANDYGYGVATDLKDAAELLRGVAQAPSIVEVASVIHDARFGPDYPEHLRNSFEGECASGRAYCIKLARAVLDSFRLSHIEASSVSSTNRETHSDGAIYAEVSRRSITPEEDALLMKALRDGAELIEELPSTDHCPDCGRPVDGPTHAAYCTVPSTDRGTEA